MNEGDAEQAAPLPGRQAAIGRRRRRRAPASAVTVITAFKRGFSRSIRAKKCRVSSTLEICLAAKRSASSPMERLCIIVTGL